MKKVHPIWQKNQSFLENYPVEHFWKHPIIRKWLLGVGPHTSSELLEAAHNENPEQFDRLFPYLLAGRDLEDTQEVPPSKKSALQFFYIMRMMSAFPEWKKFNNVLEIGGGYGNLARLFIELDICNTYHIADIAVISDISQFFLRTHLDLEQQKRTCVFNVEREDRYQELKNSHYDLVISTFALSECPADVQKVYIEDIISHIPYLYVVGQSTFRDFNVETHLLGILGQYFNLHQGSYPFYEKPSFEVWGRNKFLAPDGVLRS